MSPLGFDDLAEDIHDCSTFSFGEEFIYKPKEGGQFRLVGIFNEIHEQVDPDTERIVATNTPSVGIKLKDLPVEPKKGDIVLRLSKNTKFRVIDSQEDGEGMSQMFLHRIGES